MWKVWAVLAVVCLLGTFAAMALEHFWIATVCAVGYVSAVVLVVTKRPGA